MPISCGLLMTDKVTPAMKYQVWGGNEGWPRRKLSSAGDRIRGGDGGAIATNVQRKQALEYLSCRGYDHDGPARGPSCLSPCSKCTTSYQSLTFPSTHPTVQLHACVWTVEPRRRQAAVIELAPQAVELSRQISHTSVDLTLQQLECPEALTQHCSNIQT